MVEVMASWAEVAVPLFVIPARDVLFSVSVLVCSSKLLMVFSMSSFVLFTLSGSLIIKIAWFPIYSVSMSTWCFIFVFMTLSLLPFRWLLLLLFFRLLLFFPLLSWVVFPVCLFCLVLFFLFVLSRVINTFSPFTSVTLSLLVYMNQCIKYICIYITYITNKMDTHRLHINGFCLILAISKKTNKKQKIKYSVQAFSGREFAIEIKLTAIFFGLTDETNLLRGDARR